MIHSFNYVDLVFSNENAFNYKISMGFTEKYTKNEKKPSQNTPQNGVWGLGYRVNWGNEQ